MVIVRLATLSGDFKMIDTLNSTPHKHIIDTVTSYETKIILDTLRLPSNESLDLISKVDTFYNNAWIKLSLTVTIFFILTGVIVPIIVQLYQKKVLKLEEQKLKAEIESSELRLIAKIKEESQSTLKILTERINALESELNTKVSARTNHLQAMIETGKNDYTRATYLYSLSAKSLLINKEFGNAQVALYEMTQTIKKVNKKDLDQMYKNKSYTFTTFLEEIQELGKSNDDVLNYINDIKRSYEDLFVAPTPPSSSPLD